MKIRANSLSGDCRWGREVQRGFVAFSKQHQASRGGLYPLRGARSHAAFLAPLGVRAPPRRAVRPCQPGVPRPSDRGARSERGLGELFQRHKAVRRGNSACGTDACCSGLPLTGLCTDILIGRRLDSCRPRGREGYGRLRTTKELFLRLVRPRASSTIARLSLRTRPRLASVGFLWEGGEASCAPVCYS